MIHPRTAGYRLLWDFCISRGAWNPTTRWNLHAPRGIIPTVTERVEIALAVPRAVPVPRVPCDIAALAALEAALHTLFVILRGTERAVPVAAGAFAAVTAHRGWRAIPAVPSLHRAQAISVRVFLRLPITGLSLARLQLWLRLDTVEGKRREEGEDHLALQESSD
eukprot:scaffold126304_cov72-Phaeocystis_antarctica.AAC.1